MSLGEEETSIGTSAKTTSFAPPQPITDQQITNLIKYSFIQQSHRQPIKKDQILSQILPIGGNTKRLRALLHATNQRLERDFGMCLVGMETVSRIKSTSTVAGRRAATISANRPTANVSGGADNATTAAAISNDNMIHASQNGNNNATANSAMIHSSYTLISTLCSPRLPYHPQPTQMAILTTALTLIHLSGPQQYLEQDKLFTKMASLGIQGPSFTEDWMQTMKRERYLSVQRKSDDLNVLLVMKGPRAQLEFPPDVLGKIVVEVVAKKLHSDVRDNSLRRKIERSFSQ